MKPVKFTVCPCGFPTMDAAALEDLFCKVFSVLTDREVELRARFVMVKETMQSEGLCYWCAAADVKQRLGETPAVPAVPELPGGAL